MKKEHPDIVIFPGWRKQLEKEGLEALKEKRYEDALTHILQLEQYEAASYEILTGKVICFIELGRYDEAIGLCRKLMKEDDPNYYKYLHIYVTILFQTSQYGEILSLLDEIFQSEKIPHTYREQFWQIYDLSQKFYQDQELTQDDKEWKQFIHNLEGGSFQEQWRLLSILRKKSVSHYIDEIIPHLSDAELNPVIKTGILQWMYEQKVDQEMEVEKFNQTSMINPIHLDDVMETPEAKKILLLLEEIEQNDPTLFEFTRQILFRYLYVYYPFTPSEEAIQSIAEAVLALALEYLQLDQETSMLEYDNEARGKWMEEIKHMEMKYFSQIEQ
ncbi:tetratricopeptide (TPR) repeat protein [Salirhabdus euzebyi]|uniref:Tetratricopeptide (TPR) repeat protein n=1 Tax=Salirhabdus euzebyi TaxID=394506 RepID=A0A841Q1C4_9BACI|nr:DUF3196 family protein [Salirhabdus euzebyi]MBB6451943.1 tetratricopeptide (TPR) repeat protein [Salirhabdus euzebyi]